MKKRVLLVDDEPRVRASLKTVLEPTYEVFEAADAAEGLRMFKHDAPDLVLLDVILPGADGLSALQTMRTENRAVPVIMLTGTKSVKTAVDAMKLGAADYLSKPFDVEELQIVIERTLGKQELEQEVRQLRAQVVQRYAFHNLIGKSPAMQEIYAKIEQVADSRTTVLVTGESGTGKELAAKAIHYNSSRRDRPFVALNCAALPETLIESELFGHEKGAFTGAVAQRPGRIETAQNGTLFLDEIGELPPPLQVKLLRFLQEQRIERVGGRESIPVNVRVLAATHVDLKQAMASGRFREDLFYRLNVVELSLPPLRERREDILPLAQLFLAELAQNRARLSPAAAQLLERHSWPGNIRELRNVITRAVLLASGGVIQRRHLHLDVDAGDRRPAAAPTSPPSRPRSHANTAPVAPVTDPPTAATTLSDAMREVERARILETLERYGGNQTRAARELGIARGTLVARLTAYGVIRPRKS
ncbi:MAG TPA: DNA-binding response regulator [Nitrospira sp.]|nr:DNA-binding response regulator [Nitrospira sp.]